MFRTLIIEDKKSSQELLSSVLQLYCPQLQLIGVVSSSKGIVESIKTKFPDLIFWDIESDECTISEILDSLEEINFSIVFTSANGKFAVDAFKYSAIDYILKPYKPIDLIKAIDKAKKLDFSYNLVRQFRNFILHNTKVKSSKIKFSTLKGIKVIEMDDIVRVEADGAYSKIIINDSQLFLATRTLKSIEDLIANGSFCRIHSRHLVNMNFVSEYCKEGGGILQLNNGDRVPLSRRRKSNFLNELQEL